VAQDCVQDELWCANGGVMIDARSGRPDLAVPTRHSGDDAADGLRGYAGRPGLRFRMPPLVPFDRALAGRDRLDAAHGPAVPGAVCRPSSSHALTASATMYVRRI
jgi:hypothetical protein